MNIDESLIRKVAKIARLEISDEEVKRFLPQFQEILNAFDVLRQADVSGLKPCFHPVEIPARLRKDSPMPCLDQEKALALSIHRQDGYFKGPRAIK